MQGTGARLVKRAIELKCEVYLARVWTVDDRQAEMRMKRRNNSYRYCPICCGTGLGEKLHLEITNGAAGATPLEWPK